MVQGAGLQVVAQFNPALGGADVVLVGLGQGLWQGHGNAGPALCFTEPGQEQAGIRS